MSPEDSIILYHLCTPEQWEQARKPEGYRPDSLATEGFIHLSKKAQLPATYQRFFKDFPELLLLCIRLREDDARLRFEDSYGHGARFPHYYAPLPMAAIERVLPLPVVSAGKHAERLSAFWEEL